MYTYGWIILLWSRDYSTVYNRNDNPLQYSCLDNPMDKGAWRAIVHGVMKSQTQLKQLSTHSTHTPTKINFKKGHGKQQRRDSWYVAPREVQLSIPGAIGPSWCMLAGAALSRTQCDSGSLKRGDGQNYADRCKHKGCDSSEDCSLNFCITDNSHTQNWSMVGRLINRYEDDRRWIWGLREIFQHQKAVQINILWRWHSYKLINQIFYNLIYIWCWECLK